jgi:hypothetical protein
MVNLEGFGARFQRGGKRGPAGAARQLKRAGRASGVPQRVALVAQPEVEGRAVRPSSPAAGRWPARGGPRCRAQGRLAPLGAKGTAGLREPGLFRIGTDP